LAGAWAGRLIERLGGSLPFYLRFYRADNAPGNEDQAPLEWFEDFVSRRPDSIS
jgi:hypothetical protein